MAARVIFSEKEKALAIALLNATLLARLGVRDLPACSLDTVWSYNDVASVIACGTELVMLCRASEVVEKVLPRVRLRLDPSEEKC